MQLKERQEKFCQSYLINRNATQSAIAAGYSEKSAHNQGWRLLQEPVIQRRLEELEQEYNTDVDVISELEKQYEAAKANNNGATALKALEILSRIRGNNAAEDLSEDIQGLEGKISASMKIIGKEKMYALFMATFPEDFEEEEIEDEDSEL
jgi:phage terminase small subunit